MQTRSSNPAKTFANRILYAATLRPLWTLGSVRQSKLPILISGSPRSGSTWLLEVIERHFAARRNWEPVGGIEQHLGGRKLRFGLRPYIGPNETDHPLARMLLGVVDGDSPRQWRRAWNTKAGIAENLTRITGAERTIIKFVEAQRCLPFIARHRDNKAVVLLRNPLSVTASALTYGGKRKFSSEPPAGPIPEVRRLSENLLRDFPQLNKYADRDMTRAEYISLSTCIDMIVPLSSSDCREKYCFASYEALKQNSANFDTILRYLGDDRGFSPEEAARLGEPSARAKPGSLVGAKRDWEGRLSNDEVDQILEICFDLGIDWYGDAPGANPVRLARFKFAHLIA